MNLACVMDPGARRGEVDRLLADFAGRLAERGVICRGLVQLDTVAPGRSRCDMDIRILPDGPVARISERRGALARGCHLDPSALERAAVRVERDLDLRTDLLIINKFGKHEAGGRGLRGAIAKAASLGIPIVLGLNDANAPAFREFSAGLAQSLPARMDALFVWYGDALVPAG